KSLGGVGSRERTPEQTEIALFWADADGTSTPPGHWNRIARTVARDRGTTMAENARLFAILNVALAAASIACWVRTCPFEYWRPGQAVGEEAPPWEPLVATPPFPSFTSGHSSFSGAAAAVLERFFGTDAVRFADVSEGLPGVVR